MLQETLHAARLLVPDLTEVVSCLQGLEPDIQADDQREHGAHHDHETVKFEPAAGGGNDDSRNGDEEGDEDQDGITYRCC